MEGLEFISTLLAIIVFLQAVVNSWLVYSNRSLEATVIGLEEYIYKQQDNDI